MKVKTTAGVVMFPKVHILVQLPVHLLVDLLVLLLLNHLLVKHNLPDFVYQLSRGKQLRRGFPGKAQTNVDNICTQTSQAKKNCTQTRL